MHNRGIVLKATNCALKNGHDWGTFLSAFYNSERKIHSSRERKGISSPMVAKVNRTSLKSYWQSSGKCKYAGLQPVSGGA